VPRKTPEERWAYNREWRARNAAKHRAYQRAYDQRRVRDRSRPKGPTPEQRAAERAAGARYRAKVGAKELTRRWMERFAPGTAAREEWTAKQVWRQQRKRDEERITKAHELAERYVHQDQRLVAYDPLYEDAVGVALVTLWRLRFQGIEHREAKAAAEVQAFVKAERARRVKELRFHRNGLDPKLVRRVF
jgi:hypothetical protein